MPADFGADDLNTLPRRHTAAQAVADLLRQIEDPGICSHFDLATLIVQFCEASAAAGLPLVAEGVAQGDDGSRLAAEVVQLAVPGKAPDVKRLLDAATASDQLWDEMWRALLDLFRRRVIALAPTRGQHETAAAKPDKPPAEQPERTGAGRDPAEGERPLRAGAGGPARKRSTKRADGRVKLIAALTKHHQYANGSCLNLEPIGSNELAKAADVSKSTASAFFQNEFEGHTKYKALCRDASGLVAALKLLNNEFSPHHLYGRRPAGEDDRDAEGDE